MMKMGNQHLTLQTLGFNLGDIVRYTDTSHSPGGIIYRITEFSDPVKPHATNREYKVHKIDSNGSIREEIRTERGHWDEKGRAIPVMYVEGFIRLNPIFEFFGMGMSKKPKGHVVHYRLVPRYVEHVDLVKLGLKYVELGNLIRDIAKSRGG
jgi:hypothetical protein